MSPSIVAEFIRSHLSTITHEWERLVLVDVKRLGTLERGALLDHLPETLDALADWIDGRVENADRLFNVLADGHALQRLGYGFDIASITVEYSRLRKVLLTALLTLAPSQEVTEQLIRCNEGLDRAIGVALRRFNHERDQVRERFIGVLGHDLRNPLNSIRLSAQLLLRSESIEPGNRKRVLTIVSASDRMTRLVGDILDFARGHLGGGIPATPSKCDIGQLCQAGIDEARINHPDRELTLQTTGNLRGAFDAERLLQAFGNLIANAIQHGTDPIEVAAWEADDRHAVFIRVSNGGAPIPPERQAQLFEPFGATGRASGGLGLGLYIVGLIIRAHGGTCDVSSTPERTSLTIRLARTPFDELADRT